MLRRAVWPRRRQPRQAVLGGQLGAAAACQLAHACQQGLRRLPGLQPQPLLLSLPHLCAAAACCRRTPGCRHPGRQLLQRPGGAARGAGGSACQHRINQRLLQPLLLLRSEGLAAVATRSKPAGRRQGLPGCAATSPGRTRPQRTGTHAAANPQALLSAPGLQVWQEAVRRQHERSHVAERQRRLRLAKAARRQLAEVCQV